MLFLASRFGYAPFAGTALMAAATHLVAERGEVTQDGSHDLIFETAAGLTKIVLQIEASTAVRATWETEPPRLLAKDLQIDCSDGVQRRCSLVTAGLPYIVVDTSALGVSLQDHAKLGPAAASLSADVARVAPMESFGIANEYARFLIMAIEPTEDGRVRTAWVSDAGEVALSPGGTGALAVFWAM